MKRKMSVFKTEIVPESSGKLGIIGLMVQDTKEEKYIAKAPCNMEVEEKVPYTLMVWNVRYITCPVCNGKQDKSCKLCEGKKSVLTFSYVMKRKGETIGGWDDVDVDKEKADALALKHFVEKIESKKEVKGEKKDS